MQLGHAFFEINVRVEKCFSQKATYKKARPPIGNLTFKKYYRA